MLVLPAIGTTFTVDEVLADPIGTNTMLGHYTHFGNLLDLCAAVVPAGLTADGRPAALMVLGPALADDRVLAVAAALSGQLRVRHQPAGRSGADGTTTLVVVGHHLSGQPRNADLVRPGRHAAGHAPRPPSYRLLRTGGATPVPVLVTAPDRRRRDRGGDLGRCRRRPCPRSSPDPARRSAWAGSSWPTAAPRSASSPTPPPSTDEDLADITAFGGWRAYLAAH